MESKIRLAQTVHVAKVSYTHSNAPRKHAAVNLDGVEAVLIIAVWDAKRNLEVVVRKRRVRRLHLHHPQLLGQTRR